MPCEEAGDELRKGALCMMPPVWTGLTVAFASALVTNTAYSLEHDAAAALPPLSPRQPFRSAKLHRRAYAAGVLARRHRGVRPGTSLGTRVPLGTYAGTAPVTAEGCGADGAAEVTAEPPD